LEAAPRLGLMRAAKAVGGKSDSASAAPYRTIPKSTAGGASAAFDGGSEVEARTSRGWNNLPGC